MFSRDDISRNGLQVPALGRKFKLGSLYDAIHEDIIPGKSIKLCPNYYSNILLKVLNKPLVD
jgi:hypothetical protein